MSKELTHILSLAQDLSRAEQLRLIQAIAAIVQIQDAGMSSEMGESWQVEIERRLELFDSDQMKGRPWREVIEELKGVS